MKIVIDLQGAQSIGSRNRGIGRYSMSLTKAIISNKKEHDVHILMSDLFPDSVLEIKEQLSVYIPKLNIHIMSMPHNTRFINQNNEAIRKSAEIIRECFIEKLKPDVLLITSLFEGFIDDSVTSVKSIYKNTTTAVILYDLIPLLNASQYLGNVDVKKWYEEKIEHLKKADLLLSISESSKNEAIENLQRTAVDTVNISTAQESHFKVIQIDEIQEETILKKYKLKKKFIMYTGGIDYRKNIEGLISAYALLCDQLRSMHKLAIICAITEEDKTRLTKLVLQNELSSDDVVFTGFVVEKDLLNLYNLCEVFVFPSLHEGFGLPVLEAMSCAKAVIGSNTSSIPEVIGNEDALFDPRDTDEIASKLTKVLTDKEYKTSLEKHGLTQSLKFSWDKTAVAALSAMEENFKKRPKQIENTKTLAYLSPLGSDKSGINDYSKELIPVLSQYYTIDLITNHENIDTNLQIKSLEYFKHNYSKYDRILYHVGNSCFHYDMLELLRITSGVVVLHDFFLSHLKEFAQSKEPEKFNLFTQAYNSHGYNVVKTYSNSTVEELIWSYPLNNNIFQDSLGIITHSETSKNLAKDWYGDMYSESIETIPLLRSPSNHKNIDVSTIRKKLGFKDSDFIICSFGLLGKSKKNQELLNAFLESNISDNKNVFLVFVGKNSQDCYGTKLQSSIKEHKCHNQVKITGWLDKVTFEEYLSISSIAVQLRAFSRGETSAAVLDCMNYAIPTIVNANGSMVELPKDAVYMIEDNFTIDQLKDALELLYKDKTKKEQISKNAIEIIEKFHNPQKCAKSYYSAIENFYADNFIDKEIVFRSIGNIDNINDDILKSISISMAQNLPKRVKQKQLFIDVSVLVEVDAKSGIQRVVKNILKQFILNPPKGYRIEPVYANTDSIGYMYARSFTCEFLGVDNFLNDETIDFYEEDIFLGLDFTPHILKYQAVFFEKFKIYNVKIIFIIYDLLPLQLSEYFNPLDIQNFKNWLHEIIKYDQVIAISKTIAQQLQGYIQKNSISTSKNLKISSFHLGVDMQEILSSNLNESSDAQLKQFKLRQTFLMVGTLEPRKGYFQTLKSFEILWNENIEINLVIIGKKGWLVEELVQKIKNHPRLNKNLFWLNDVSDEYLQKVYEASACLIAASEGEGFGLPLIEASKYKLPIIARDIPVFREVASDFAYYYKNTKDPFELADTIKKWLELYAAQKHPSSENMPYLTWKESAKQLVDAFLD